MRLTPICRTVHGARSWRLASDRVEAWLTCEGGHLAPVGFRLGRKRVHPLAVAPWQPGDVRRGLPRVLRPLRGDFFCCPFGDNGTAWHGERHPPHGETASAVWQLQGIHRDGSRVRLTAVMDTRIRRGRVLKAIELRDGETNVYCRHELAGYHGQMCLGHHAMLQFPETEGAGHIALAPFKYGRVLPGAFERPVMGGFQSLDPGSTFGRLERVRMANGGYADLSRYPARAGFEDLVMVSALPGAVAWTAVCLPAQGYLWFALKDPRVLPSTVLWHSNGGRHYPPWSGRHRGVLGLEEVVGYFHLGLAASARANDLSRKGIRTAVRLSPRQSYAVNYIMGVTAVPRTFGRPDRVEFHARGVSFFDAKEAKIDAAVDWTFVRSATP